MVASEGPTRPPAGSGSDPGPTPDSEEAALKPSRGQDSAGVEKTEPEGAEAGSPAPSKSGSDVTARSPGTGVESAVQEPGTREAEARPQVRGPSSQGTPAAPGGSVPDASGAIAAGPSESGDDQETRRAPASGQAPVATDTGGADGSATRTRQRQDAAQNVVAGKEPDRSTAAQNGRSASDSRDRRPPVDGTMGRPGSREAGPEPSALRDPDRGMEYWSSISPPGDQDGPIARPSFDVVRTSPSGDIIVAGRAAPGATVTVRSGDQVLGQLQPDRNGEWVLIPEEPLDPGTYELSLSATFPDRNEIAGDETVLVIIPERGRGLATRDTSDPMGSLVVSLPKRTDQVPVLLEPPGGTGDDRLSVDIIDYGETGEDLILSGRASREHEVRLYLGDEYIGRAQPDGDGKWELRPDRKIPGGDYRLRADLVDRDGQTVSRIELPFSRSRTVRYIPSTSRVIVQPGNSLWRIARAVYGRGIRYTVIYERNRDQIRDPHWIYPGQVFQLPELR